MPTHEFTVDSLEAQWHSKEIGPGAFLAQVEEPVTVFDEFFSDCEGVEVFERLCYPHILYYFLLRDEGWLEVLL